MEPVVQFAGHEDLAALNAGGGDRLPDLFLVAVHLGGVDVTVTHLERGQSRLFRFVGFDLEDAESQLGDLDAVVQGHSGNIHASTLRAWMPCAMPLALDRSSACSVAVGRLHRPDGGRSAGSRSAEPTEKRPRRAVSRFLLRRSRRRALASTVAARVTPSAYARRSTGEKPVPSRSADGGNAYAAADGRPVS